MAKSMSKDHKQALAKGREQGKAVRDYLDALEKERKPGRKMDRGTIETRIDSLQDAIEQETDPAKRVSLIQKRLDLQERLASLDDEPDLESLEAAFIEVAAEFSERKSLSYTAWREAGVSAATLSAAGVPRTRRTF